MWNRPDGEAWAVTYDLVLHDLVYAEAALVCAAAARRAQADRMAWSAMPLSVVWGPAGTWSTAWWWPDARAFPSIADVCYLGHYVPLYVALIGLIRARVVRFHASMWLDGIIGALGAGTVVGVETLVRWQHPTRGLLMPGDLLPAAEQAGLMRPLTDRVLELSLGAVARWWPTRRVPVSVNLSAANVCDLDLPSEVAMALLRHGLPPAALTLELVEDTLMADPGRGRTVLADLRRLGVRTSIDDYGTGYGSLAYLRLLPADELELDRSLTRDVGSDPRAAAIVRYPVALAHDLGLSLVAEGVEDDEMGLALAAPGCDVAQGYAIARPMPVEDLLTWMARRRQPAAVAVTSRVGPAERHVRGRRVQVGEVEDRRWPPARAERQPGAGHRGRRVAAGVDAGSVGSASRPPSRRSHPGCAVPGDRAG